MANSDERKDDEKKENAAKEYALKKSLEAAVKILCEDIDLLFK